MFILKCPYCKKYPCITQYEAKSNQTGKVRKFNYPEHECLRGRFKGLYGNTHLENVTIEWNRLLILLTGGYNL